MTAASKRDEAFAERLQEVPTREEWRDFFTRGFSKTNPVQVRDRALFLLMYRSGLRIGEACALDLDDLDPVEGRVTVPSVRGGEIGKGKGLTKTGSRTTYFHPQDKDLQDALRSWLAVRRSWNPTTERLFVTAQGEPINDTTLLRIAIGKAAERAFPDGQRVAGQGYYTATGHRIHAHALRHAYATQSRDSGMPLDVLQKGLGHSSIDMTLRYDTARGQRVKEWYAGQDSPSL